MVSALKNVHDGGTKVHIIQITENKFSKQKTPNVKQKSIKNKRGESPPRDRFKNVNKRSTSKHQLKSTFRLTPPPLDLERRTTTTTPFLLLFDSFFVFCNGLFCEHDRVNPIKIIGDESNNQTPHLQPRKIK